ncbi:MAG: DUF5994 family protein [Jatrophihabitans sp.]|uniref:DUF5994 family protein n=1 Tax=Jatrophihabitans sp. TaxID=1932789 RepID=UPI003F7E5B81
MTLLPVAHQVDRRLDGVWWPSSLDLVAEVPPLVAAVEAAGYPRVRRISFALSGWDASVPRRITLRGSVIRLGGFNSQDEAELMLVDSSGWQRVLLLVLPPETAHEVAARAMAGITSSDHVSARELLERARTDGANLDDGSRRS